MKQESLKIGVGKSTFSIRFSRAVKRIRKVATLYFPEMKVADRKLQAKERPSARNGKRCKPIVQMDGHGVFVREYPSISDAARHGFNAALIQRVLRGGCSQHGGYRWKFKEALEIEPGRSFELNQVQELMKVS